MSLDEASMSLDERFLKAVEDFNNLKNKPPSDSPIMLKIDALYKRATMGDCPQTSQDDVKEYDNEKVEELTGAHGLDEHDKIMSQTHNEIKKTIDHITGKFSTIKTRFLKEEKMFAEILASLRVFADEIDELAGQK